MPMKPHSVCSYPGCGAYAVKLGRCEQHKHKPWIKHTRQEYDIDYGARWRKIRQAVLVRDDGLCCVCKRKGATEVDHIIPKSQGGSDDDENLQAICKQCHWIKTKAEIARARNRNVLPGIKLSNSIIIYGPPGAGKSKVVKDNYRAGDVVIDLDNIIAEQTGNALYVKTKEQLSNGLRRKLEMINTKQESGIKWIITTCKSEMQALIKQGAALVTICPNEAVVYKNIQQDFRRPEAVKKEQLDAAKQWFDNNLAMRGGYDLTELEQNLLRLDYARQV